MRHLEGEMTYLSVCGFRFGLRYEGNVISNQSHKRHPQINNM